MRLVVVMLVVTLGGCELVAGIKDRSLATGGTGAGQAGGTGGSAGPGGMGGVAGSAGVGGMGGGRVGAACPNLGNLDCDGQRSRQQIACGPGNVWVQNGLCPEGQHCDSSAGPTIGTCRNVLAECAGHSVGDHVCLGGELRACGPDLITSELVDGCAAVTGECTRCRPTLVVAGPPGVREVVIDAANVYWTEVIMVVPGGIAVKRAPLDGTGGATMLAAAGGRSGGSPPFAVDSAYAYVAYHTTGPEKVSLQGGGQFRLDTSGTSYGSSATGLAIDEAHAYWAAAAHQGGAILKVPLATGAGETIAYNQGTIVGPVLDATSVYWGTTAGSIMKVSKAGGETTQLVSGQQPPRGIAVAGGNVYWHNGGGTVGRVSVDGGAAAMLASGPGETGQGRGPTSGIGADAATAYWANTLMNTIMRVPVGGGVMVTVASASSPAAVVVDATHVYWANSADGTIMRIRK